MTEIWKKKGENYEAIIRLAQIRGMYRPRLPPNRVAAPVTAKRFRSNGTTSSAPSSHRPSARVPRSAGTSPLAPAHGLSLAIVQKIVERCEQRLVRSIRPEAPALVSWRRHWPSPAVAEPPLALDHTPVYSDADYRVSFGLLQGNSRVLGGFRRAPGVRGNRRPTRCR
jgi:hypothetical protein